MIQQPVAPVAVVGRPPGDVQRPRIRLSRNGPCLVAADHLINSKGARLEARHGVALCRCGASNGKPFCDGSHIRIGFSDERGVGRTPEGVDDRGAAGGVRSPRHDAPGADDVSGPSIRIARNGPYVVQGFDLDTEAWSEGVSRERYKLCRCGGSMNKPFCDGSHRRIGFQDDSN